MYLLVGVLLNPFKGTSLNVQPGGGQGILKGVGFFPHGAGTGWGWGGLFS